VGEGRPAAENAAHLAADADSLQGHGRDDQEPTQPNGELSQPLASAMGHPLPSIHQFAPTTPDPELYAKLKAVSQER
jgi:hypothetical protein